MRSSGVLSQHHQTNPNGFFKRLCECLDQLENYEATIISFCFDVIFERDFA